MRTAYIISYLPRNYLIREKRVENHRKQIDFFLGHGFNIVIFPQNYNRGDRFKHDAVSYLRGRKGPPLPPGAARNQLLKAFYKTDLPFAVFADDDAIIDDHGDGMDAICAPLDYPEKFDSAALLAPVNPVRRGFNKMYANNPGLFQKSWSLAAIDSLKGSLFALRNMPLSGSAPYFFDGAYDDDGAGGFIGGEDGDFAMQLIRDGHGTYTMENCVLKELGGVSASTWATTTSERTAQQKRFMALLATKYGPDGFDPASPRKWASFWEKNSKRQRRLIIPK